MNLETIATAPFTAGDEHRRLATLAGDWRGTAQTWLHPDNPPLEGAWEGRIALLLGGRFVRFEYGAHVGDKPHAGELVVAYETPEKFWRMSWIDSFHTSPGILLSTGVPGERAMRATASYYAGEGEPRWSWRTEIDDPEGDTLQIRMINILPDGLEAKAVTIDLQRTR
jgi:hypothetical protein